MSDVLNDLLFNKGICINILDNGTLITYNSNRYIIELKIWHGEKYHERGLKQLEDYLEINNQNRGYLLVFNFNKDKEYKKEIINCEGKEIVAVFV